jgi:5-methylcytosine-specific restriction endonuclease McrA
MTPEEQKVKTRQYGKTYEAKDPERRRRQKREASKRWREKNLDKARAANLESSRKRKERDPVVFNAKNAETQTRARRRKGIGPKVLLDPAERKLRDRAAHDKWVSENTELHKQIQIDSSRSYRENNPDKCKEMNRKWRENNPDKVKARNLRSKHRRRMKLENQPDVDILVWRETLELFEYKCAYCLDWATSLDHIVPVDKGGTNDPGNCIPACTRCNSSKGSKDIGVWLKTSRIAKEALSRPFNYTPIEKEPKLKIIKKQPRTKQCKKAA